MSEHGYLQPKPPGTGGVWSWPLAIRGFGLLTIAGASLGVLGVLGRHRPVVALVASPVLASVAVLASWAAAIHLSGGSETDDHPWV